MMQSSGMLKEKLRVVSTDLKEVDSHVYLGQEMNMHHSLRPEVENVKGLRSGANSIALLIPTSRSC